MCWYHVTKKVDEQLRSLPKKIASQIRRDINHLQLCSTVNAFDKASDLLLEKLHHDEKVKMFIEYFHGLWLVKQRFWFEGTSCQVPSTNNALEANNSVLKKRTHFS